MNKETINKFTTKFTSETRRPLITLILIILVVTGIIIFAFASMTSERDESQGSFDVAVNSNKAAVDPNLSSSHKDAIRSKNEEQYKKAQQTPGGVAIPFVIDGQRQITSDRQDASVQTCGCTMSDEQFAKMLSRAGVTSAGGTPFAEQIGNSDIFITADKYLADSNGIKLKLNNKNVKLGEKGLLVDQIGNPHNFNDDTALYLSNDGSIIDSGTNIVPLRGSLLTAEGIIVLGNGKYAFRPGNMTVEGRSDVYLTIESQLVTVDGKGIRHAGNFVFRNLERELVNFLTVPLRWQNSVVSQNRQGHIVDPQGVVFDTPGVLFSYDGTMIDNYGKLTAQLISLRRLGESDLYIDDDSVVRDRFSGLVLNYGDPMRIGVGDQLFVKNGFAINHKQAKVRISSTGQLQVDVGKGSVRSGWTKNSQQVAIDRFGHLLSRQGKLTRRGNSVVHLSADGFLADKDGKALHYRNKDMFLDFNAYLDGGLIGLSTFDGLAVTDNNQQRVYLSEQGEFVTQTGVLAKIGVSITDSTSSVVQPNGKLASTSSDSEQLLSSSGQPILYKGKEVYIGENGKLFDADGNPIVASNGSALFLNDSGFIVDDSNNVVDTSAFVTASGVQVDNGRFTSMAPLVDGNGNPISYNGRQIYKKGSKLYYADGSEVRDAEGSALSVSQNGTVISDKGKVENRLSSMLKRASTSGELVSKNGKPIKFNGKNVFRRSDGTLVDENGALILTKDGKTIKLDASGKLLDSSGQPVLDRLFTDSNSLDINSDLLDAPGTLSEVTFAGKPLFYNGRQVYRRADGTIVDAQNVPILDKNGLQVKLNKNGQIVDSNGDVISGSLFTNKRGELVQNSTIDAPNSTFERLTSGGEPLYFQGKEIYRRSDGVLVDKLGNVLKNREGKSLKVTSNGQITDEDGVSIRDSIFNTKSGRKVGPRNIDNPSFNNVPLTSNGESLFLNGKQIWKNGNGELVDRFGKQFTDKNGKALRLDENGNIINEDGTIVRDLKVTNRDGKVMSSWKADALNGYTAVTSNGKPLFYNGKQIFRRADGKLVDESGKLVTTKSGKAVTLSLEGELIDSDGNAVYESLLSDKDGNSISSSLIDPPAFESSPLTISGKGAYFNGKKVWRKKDGTLVDSNGVPILDSSGNELFVDEKGVIRNSEGETITSNIFTDNDGRELATSQIDAESQSFKRLTVDGKPIFFNGRQVYRRADGVLVDSDGKPLITANGSKITMTDDGEFLNDNGTIINDSIFKDALGNLVKNKDIANPTFSRTGLSASGKPIYYKGKRVFRNSDGLLVDESGALVLTKDGKTVSYTSAGILVDEDGRIIRENLFTTKDGKDISNASLDVVSASPMLLTSNGKPLFLNGKKAFKRADGMLVDASGNLIRTASGKTLRMNPNGSLSDSFGNIISEAVFKNADGISVETRNVDTQQNDAIPLTANSKPLFYNGKQVWKRADGVLITEDGNVVTDPEGKVISISKDGVIANSDGKVVSGSVFKDANGQTIQNTSIDALSESFKPVTVGGKGLYFNGKRVFKRKDGLLVDERGNLITTRSGSPLRVDSKGRIIDGSGKIVEAPMFTTKDGQPISNAKIDIDTKSNIPLTANSAPLFYKGKQVFKRADGTLVDVNGNEITTANGESIAMLSDGTFVTSTGTIIDDNLFTDQNGRNVNNSTIDVGRQQFEALSIDGKPIYFNGKQVFRRADGILVDSSGKPVTTTDGLSVKLNAAGELIDEQGNIAKEPMFTDKDGISIPSLKIDRDVFSTPVLANGKPIFYKGKQVFKRADGTLVDSNGARLLDDKGREISITRNGNIVSADGERLDDIVLTDSSGNRILPKDLDAGVASAQALMQNGKPVFINGKQIFTRSDGTLIDKQGNVILDENGNELVLNDSGLVTLPNGELPSGVSFTSADGNKLTSRLFTPRKFTAQPITAGGKSVFFKGDKVYRRADGKLVNAQGVLVKDINGKTLSMDEDGNIRDHNGNILTTDIFTDEKGKRVKTTALDKPKSKITAVTANGKDVYINGKKVFRREDGTLVDENNIPIKLNNKTLSIKSDGVLRDIDGKEITETVFTDVAGRPVMTNSIDPVSTEVLKMVTSNGKPVLYDGKNVFRRVDGSLVDDSGKIITDINGEAIFLKDNGDLVNAIGEAVTTPLFQDVDGNRIKNNNLDSTSDLPEAVQVNGVALQYKGKPVYKTKTGQLIDSMGNQIVGKDGRPVFLNKNGQIVNDLGNSTSVDGLTSLQPVSNGNFKTRTNRQSTGKRLFTEDGFLLDENGKAVTFNGQSVKQGADGFLYTESGEPVRTKDGLKVRLDESGTLINEDGKSVKESLLKNGDGVALYSNGKPVTTAMKQIGKSDLYLTKDGRVVDSQGRAMTIDDEDVYIDPETGALVNIDGKPFRDANANTMFLTDSGTIVDSSLKPATGLLMKTADGVALTSSGMLANDKNLLTQVDGTDYFKTQDGLLVDDSGLPILIDGQAAYIDEQGRLVNSKSRELRYRGQRVSIDANGNLVGQNGDVLTDTDGTKLILSDISDSEQPALRREIVSTDPIVRVVPQIVANEPQAVENPNAGTLTNPNEQVERPVSVSQVPNLVSTEPNDTLKLKGLTYAQKIRLKERYERIAGEMNAAADTVIVDANKVAISRSTYYPNAGEQKSDAENGGDVAAVETRSKVESNSELVAYAGDVLYAYTSQHLNTDLQNQLEVKIVGLPPKHKLYNAVAFATPVIRYDNVVFEFNKICPQKKKCQAFTGIALDINTASAGINADIDEHFWYRFGGLFLASFGKGVSEGIELMGDRTETSSLAGSRTIITGIDTNDVIVKGVAESGEAFLPALAARFNRPITATLPYKTELVIKVLDTIELKE